MDEGCLGVCKRSAVCTGSEKRVGNGEISPATLRNYIKAVKLFCEMNDIDGLYWKKIRDACCRVCENKNKRIKK
jgi:hypothetical protein